MTFSVQQGDALEVMKGMDDNSMDALLSDPPYGLEFMGKAWDKVVPGPDVWREALRVMKPGAYGLVFGGTRTFHRLAVALEDAGFELRDTLCWLYGSGFPKSHDLSKALDRMAGAEREVVGRKSGERYKYAFNSEFEDRASRSCTLGQGDAGLLTAPATPEAQRWSGYGTALKPAYEPVLLIQKPLAGTYAKNALTHGVGGLNIDQSRIGFQSETDKAESLKKQSKDKGGFCGNKTGIYGSGKPSGLNPNNSKGRWPSNVLLDEEAAAALDATVGTRKSGSRSAGKYNSAGRNAYGVYAANERPAIEGSEGNVSRFFYCAKSSRAERNAGLEGMPKKDVAQRYGLTAGGNTPQQTPHKHEPQANGHPTVKPLALTAYLARLILPPKRDTPRRLLVPFAGSGSEMLGGLKAGWDEVTGIELEPEYVLIAEARLRAYVRSAQASLFEEAS